MGLINTHDPLVQMKITQAVCASVAIAMTIARLYIRRGRYWYDDAFAFFALLSIMLQTAAVFMRLSDPTILPQRTKVAAYYIMTTCFSCIIWFARMSILASIIRVEPSLYRRKRLYFVGVFFMLCLIGLLAQIWTLCEREGGWKNLPAPACRPAQSIAIAQLITDIISDSILLAAPLRLLSGLQDKVLYRRLIVIFSSCVCTTIVSLVHAAYIVRNDGNKVIISALVENGVSLMVCSLPVVSAGLFRLRVPTSNLGSDPTKISALEFRDSPRRQGGKNTSTFLSLPTDTVNMTRMSWDDGTTAGRSHSKYRESIETDGAAVDTKRDPDTFSLKVDTPVDGQSQASGTGRAV